MALGRLKQLCKHKRTCQVSRVCETHFEYPPPTLLPPPPRADPRGASHSVGKSVAGNKTTLVGGSQPCLLTSG